MFGPDMAMVLWGSLLFLAIGWLLLVVLSWFVRLVVERRKSGGPGRFLSRDLSNVVWIFVGLIVLVAIGPLLMLTQVRRVEYLDPMERGVMSMGPTVEVPAISETGVQAGRDSSSQATDELAGVQGEGESAGEVGGADPGLPKTPEERRRLLKEFAGQVGKLFGGEGSVVGGEAAASPSLGESKNGEVVILELTQPMVRELLGDAAGDVLRDMQSRLPEDIREGYALIPLGRSLGSALPPVPPRLAASGLSSLADSLVSILSDPPTDSGQSAAGSSGNSGVGSKRPEWVSHHQGADARVVRVMHLGSEEQWKRERSLQLVDALREILLERAAYDQLSGDYQEAVRVAEFSVEQYVRSTYEEQVDADLGGVSGSLPVTVEYILLGVPVEQRVSEMSEIIGLVQRLRFSGLFTFISLLWLMLALLAVCFRTILPGAGRGRAVLLGWAGVFLCAWFMTGLGMSLFSGNLGGQARPMFEVLDGDLR
ncbi:MAG: hypothetical protein RL215_1412 [Planctomycetota bacterium]